jgi:hypothetical protein
MTSPQSKIESRTVSLRYLLFRTVEQSAPQAHVKELQDRLNGSGSASPST